MAVHPAPKGRRAFGISASASFRSWSWPHRDNAERRKKIGLWNTLIPKFYGSKFQGHLQDVHPQPFPAAFHNSGSCSADSARAWPEMSMEKNQITSEALEFAQACEKLHRPSPSDFLRNLELFYKQFVNNSKSRMSSGETARKREETYPGILLETTTKPFAIKSVL